MGAELAYETQCFARQLVARLGYADGVSAGNTSRAICYASGDSQPSSRFADGNTYTYFAAFSDASGTDVRHPFTHSDVDSNAYFDSYASYLHPRADLDSDAYFGAANPDQRAETTADTRATSAHPNTGTTAAHTDTRATSAHTNTRTTAAHTDTRAATAYTNTRTTAADTNAGAATFLNCQSHSHVVVRRSSVKLGIL